MDLIEKFLDFLYSGSYSCTADATGRGKTTLHVKMYSLGDKYDIPKLRDLAITQLASTLDDKTTPHKDLLEAIPLIYECTMEKDRKFRDLVVLSARARRAEIFKNATLKSQLADVFSSTPDFSMDMLASFTTEPAILKCHFCASKNPLLKVRQLCSKCERALHVAGVY